ncbi:MAG: LPS assembly protein LptD [Acidobacteriaceae bacterium]
MLWLLCHCLVALQLFGSDVPAVEKGQKPEDVTIQAEQQEKNGATYTLKGNVEISFRNYTLNADEITYDSDTGIATANGHVQLQGGDEDVLIKGSHASYNLQTEMGKFFDVLGTAGMEYRGGAKVTLTTVNPFVFRGKEVDKIGQRHYLLHDGMVTSCTLPNPKWSFRSGKVEFTLGGTAKIYRSTFRIREIPVLYLPFAEHPAESLGRQTGFLVPTAGVSTRKGLILGDSFYWAIDRSMDATLGAEYFSNRGWAQHGEFRARPDEDSKIDATYFGVLDRGIKTTVNGQSFLQNQGGQDIKGTGTAKLPWGFHAGFSVEYLSRFLFREAWTENFSQAVDSEVKSVAFASRPENGYVFSIFAQRYQNFQSTDPGDVIQILHTPGLEFSSVERELFGPVYWSFDTALEGLERSQPPVRGSQFAQGLRTDGLVGRADAHPHLTMPVFLRGWTFRPDVGMRDTYYSQRLLPNSDVGVSTDDAINRKDIEAEFELRPPTLVKVFDKPVFGRKVKHTIEARAIYRYVNGIENFGQILRFDERDIASDTNEVEYGLVQRIYTKRAMNTKDCEQAMTDEEKQKACGSPQEFISWEVAQKYYFDPTFGGTVVNGVRNVFTTSEDLTGIAFITGPRNYSPVISRLRVHTTDKSQLEWALDYDPKLGQLTSSNLVFDYRVRDFTFGASHTFLRAPGEVFTLTTPNGNSVPAEFNQYRLLAGYGSPSKRGFSIAGNVGVDAVFSNVQYEAAQTSYNWDCCGLSFEYRRFSLGTVRNESQYRFAFTLANIGTFGNLKRQERLF